MKNFYVSCIRRIVISIVGIAGILAGVVVLSQTGVIPVDKAGNDEVRVPIIMYHSVLKNAVGANKFIISPSLLESDLKYIKENGYTTVFISDLITYVYDGKALPEKPIVLTFDDGYYNNLTYVLPLLEKYDMKAVISIVGKYTEAFSESEDLNPNYSYLTWSDITEIASTGYVEIQNHSYNLHSMGRGRNGADRNRWESMEHYQQVVGADIQKLQDKLKEESNVTPTAFVYPYGRNSKSSDSLMRSMGFLATITCRERANMVSDADSLFGLGRFNRPCGVSTEKFMQKIEE